MSKDSDRLYTVVSQKRVKLHIFEPSQRKIWTVVGKAQEHWADPESNFCSCLGFYFKQTHGKTSCYHLDSISLAIKEDKVETINFSDDEFSGFLSALISEL